MFLDGPQAASSSPPVRSLRYLAMKGIVFPSASNAAAGRTFASGRPQAFAMSPIWASNSKTTSSVSPISLFAPKIGLGT